MEKVIKVDVDPALFRGVTKYVVRPTATEGVPEIVHDVGDSVTPVGRAGETEHDVTAAAPLVQVIMIVGKVIPTTISVSSGRLVYEQPLGAMTSEGIATIDCLSDNFNCVCYR